MRKSSSLFLILVLFSLALGSGSAAAQAADPPPAPMGTAFSYQGLLKINGSPANGLYDFSFRLYSDSGGVTPVSAALEIGDVTVTDGLFNVMLDFGAVFNGEERYLQTAVRPGAESGAYTALTPLRKISPTPYALFAAQAGSMPWSGLTDRPAGLDDGDNDTTYAAGAGLDLTDTTFSLLDAFKLPQDCQVGEVAKWSTSMQIWYCDKDFVEYYYAGPGLSLSPSNVFSLPFSYSLPQTCSGGEIPEWYAATGVWICAADSNNIYNAGSGLDLVDGYFSILAAYRLPYPCANGQIAKWNSTGQTWYCANDTDTTYTSSTGLTLAGNAFLIALSYRLPQGCNHGQIPSWDIYNQAWYCADDKDTTYTAGTGLYLAGGAFNITSAYRLPQSCATGQVAKWNAPAASWQCADDTGATYTAGDGIDITAYTVSAEGTPYQHVVIVAKSGGDFTTIQGALDSITADANNRYLVWVAPGIYTETVTMESFVDIQGAGQALTTVKGAGSPSLSAGVFLAADNSSLRDLTVEVTGSDYANGIVANYTSPTLQRVTVNASGGVYRTAAIRMVTSNALIEDVTLHCQGDATQVIACLDIHLNSFPVGHKILIEVEGSGYSALYGVVDDGNSVSDLTYLDIHLSGLGGSSSFSAGIIVDDNSSDGILTGLKARDFKIVNDAASLSVDSGVYNRGSQMTLKQGTILVNNGAHTCWGLYAGVEALLWLEDVDAQVLCPAGTSLYGMLLTDSTAYVSDSRIDGGFQRGIFAITSDLEVHHSRILGTLNTLYLNGPLGTRLADTQLSGGNIYNDTPPTPVVCTGVYDENFIDPGLNLCPP